MMDFMAGSLPHKLSPEAAKQCFQSKFDSTFSNLRMFLGPTDYENQSVLKLCLEVNQMDSTT